MLDQETLTQLRDVFSSLKEDLELAYAESAHPDQAGLMEMLQEVQQCSSRITLRSLGETSLLPHFKIFRATKPTGIEFTGIPGGHEFTSLIVAILNAGGSGKMPDHHFRNRVQKLEGPIRLKTYISLSCENCPDVVQALNQMALSHEDFTHEMIDGANVPAEIERLGIQGVPSIIVDGKLLHSGKSDLLELLQKLENHFGTDASFNPAAQSDLGSYDVAVIGAGPAGASAAIYSARKGLKTVLITEKIGGQVRDTKGIENLISVPYTEGLELAARLNEHLGQYPVEVFENRRVKDISGEVGKEIVLDSGEHLKAATVIITTGAKWRELQIPGEKEYMGRGVAFCPHCDGPFYKNKRVSVVGGGNSGVEAAIDLAGIASEVTLFEFSDRLKADQVLVEKLKSLPNAKVIVNARTSEVVGDGAKVIALKYEDRTTGTFEVHPVDGVFVQIGLLPNSAFLKGIVDLNPAGEIIVDAKGRTSRTGIYAAGDVTTTPFKQIIIAMGEGARAALVSFEDRMRMGV